MSRGHGRSADSWWSSNWTWAVPVGCLVLMILPIFCCGSVGVVLFQKAKGGIESSELYANAIARVEAHPEAVEALGTPIEPGWFIQGEISIEGGPARDEADLSIPLEGPNGSGRLRIVAHRESDTWVYESLLLEIDPPEGVSAESGEETVPAQFFDILDGSSGFIEPMPTDEDLDATVAERQRTPGTREPSSESDSRAAA